jgi:hypothetical protein
LSKVVVHRIFDGRDSLLLWRLNFFLFSQWELVSHLDAVANPQWELVSHLDAVANAQGELVSQLEAFANAQRELLSHFNTDRACRK